MAALNTRMEILANFCGVPDGFLSIMSVMAVRLYAQYVSIQLLTLRTSELNTEKFISACTAIQRLIKEAINGG